jgi:hypothetical protein
VVVAEGESAEGGQEGVEYEEESEVFESLEAGHFA